MRNAYTSLVRNPGMNRSLERPRDNLEGNESSLGNEGWARLICTKTRSISVQ